METIIIGKNIVWVVAEPLTEDQLHMPNWSNSIIQEDIEKEILKSDEFLAEVKATSQKIVQDLKTYFAPKERPERQERRITSDDVGMGLQVAGSVLEAIGVVVGQFCEVLLASMAGSICW